MALHIVRKGGLSVCLVISSTTQEQSGATTNAAVTAAADEFIISIWPTPNETTSESES